MAYDYPVPGYRVDMVNILRLWKSEAVESFDFEAFNRGDYYGAVSDKMRSETISKVLYPNDEPEIGKMLRLIQQYFFVSCSLQDMLRLHQNERAAGGTIPRDLYRPAQRHPPGHRRGRTDAAAAGRTPLDWEEAWEITQRTFAYTNHTLLPEALEKWPLPLFGESLPRHLEIIFEINQRFLDEVRLKYPLDDERAARLSLIDEVRAEVCPHGPPGRRGQPGGQRRGRTAHRTAQEDGAAGFLRALSGEVFQRDQRGHPAALGGLEQSPADRPDHRAESAIGWISQPEELEATGGAGGRSRIPGSLAPGQAGKQADAGPAHRRADRHHRGSGLALRCPGQTPP